MPGPLTHLRVLDLSRVLAGPWAGQTLADLGAEVVKVERPGEGDDTRRWGPPHLEDAEGNSTGEAAYYLAANRGKRAITVDLAQADGQALVRDLTARSDVLIENYKVGGLARYGLAYEDLKAVNPGLIYCSITGFGQSGPYSARPGYDFVIQAMGGLMSITGERDGPQGAGPQKVGLAIADLFTGMYATIAILAALSHREKTGEGQHIDMALLDSQVAMLSMQAMNYLTSGAVPQRMGNVHPNVVPYGVFEASDGPMVLAVGNDGQFRRYCEALGRADLTADPRFATNAARVTNRLALHAEIEPVMKTRRGADWFEALQRVGVPCGPVNCIDQVFEDPQVRHRGMRVDLPHALAGEAPQVASPMRFSATPLEYRWAAPPLGQHTEEVLAEVLGKSESEIAALRAAGVI